MGTRNLTMVIDKNNKLKVAQYGQWDGYPEGQGTTILEFARDKNKMSLLQKELENIKFFDECNDLDGYIKEFNERSTENKLTDEDNYYFDNLIIRDLGGEILNSIISIDKSKLPKEHNGTIYLRNKYEFLKDGLFCEYAYCINFATNKLQCYIGGDNLIKEFDLDNLPTTEEFFKELNERS